jgi:hypothetical protein
MDSSTTDLISIRSTLRPKFFYCWRYETGELDRANLLTGEQSCHQMPGRKFKYGCICSELPGGSLLITGGWSRDKALREVGRIDTLREWAVSSQPPMHTARYYHATVYHAQYLYVLAGSNHGYLSECERYLVAECRWEELPALPVAGYAMSAVVLANSQYALGGRVGEGDLDAIQRLSLDSLTWELMQVKLPHPARFFASFTTDTEGYLVIKETLYSFTPLEVKPIKTLPQSISCFSSYYIRGTLYYSWNDQIDSLAVGELA